MIKRIKTHNRKLDKIVNCFASSYYLKKLLCPKLGIGKFEHTLDWLEYCYDEYCKTVENKPPTQYYSIYDDKEIDQIAMQNLATAVNKILHTHIDQLMNNNERNTKCFNDLYKKLSSHIHDDNPKERYLDQMDHIEKRKYITKLLSLMNQYSLNQLDDTNGYLLFTKLAEIKNKIKLEGHHIKYENRERIKYLQELSKSKTSYDKQLSQFISYAQTINDAELRHFIWHIYTTYSKKNIYAIKALNIDPNSHTLKGLYKIYKHIFMLDKNSMKQDFYIFFDPLNIEFLEDENEKNYQLQKIFDFLKEKKLI